MKTCGHVWRSVLSLKCVRVCCDEKGVLLLPTGVLKDCLVDECVRVCCSEGVLERVADRWCLSVLPMDVKRLVDECVGVCIYEAVLECVATGVC